MTDDGIILTEGVLIGPDGVTSVPVAEHRHGDHLHAMTLQHVNLQPGSVFTFPSFPSVGVTLCGGCGTIAVDTLCPDCQAERN